MKWTKVLLVLVIPALALLFLGQSLRSPAAEAKPSAIVTINFVDCVTFGSSYDWDDNGVINPDDGAPMLSDCDTLQADGKVGKVVDILGGDRFDPEPEDLAPIDREGGQFHEGDGVMFIVAFVGNDSPVSFYTDEGVFSASGTSDAFCGPGGDFTDEDCDDDGIDDDKVVVAKLVTTPGIDRGPDIVRVRQGMVEMEEEIIVVGEPWNIELAVQKPVIQTGASSCALFTDTPTYLAALGAAEQAPVVATVTDSDGTAITGGLVGFEVDDEYKATPARILTPTLDSALGVNAPNVLCGTLNPGTVTITAYITVGTEWIDVGLDPQCRDGRHTSVEVEVKGPPTDMVLSASPGSLMCDGTATSSVSANLTDAEGEPAVDGNPVRFQAKALGNVSPLEPTSAGGAATTTLTPLSGVAGGVTVNATMTLQPIDWESMLDHPSRLINESLLSKLIAKEKAVDWRSVFNECENDIDNDLDVAINDGCPQVGSKSESGSQCDNARDDDHDGAVNDGCPEVGSKPESQIPMAAAETTERNLLVACSEAAPAEAVPAAVPAGAPVIAPPATGDGGFLGP